MFAIAAVILFAIAAIIKFTGGTLPVVGLALIGAACLSAHLIYPYSPWRRP